jgi:hypothetical protein
LCSYAFYPDSAHVVGATHFWAATGEMSGNRVSTRDSRGWIHVVYAYKWGNNYADSSEIYYSYSTDDGQTWSTMMNVSRTDSQTSYEPTLVVDNQDVLHCVWKQFETGSGYDLYYSNFNGSNWTTPTNITNQNCTGNDSHYSSMVVDSSDNLHLVYEAPIGFYNIFYTHYNGISWSSPLNISNASGDAGFPCIAIDHQDFLHVVWREAGIMYTFFDGNSWLTPEEIAYLPGGGNAYQCIGMDTIGNPHVVWMFGQNDTFNIYYITRDDSVWTSPLNISNTNYSSAYCTMTIDSLNCIYMIWVEETSLPDYELYYITNNSGIWSSIVNLTQDVEFSYCPNLGLPVKGGKVDLVWVNQDTQQRLVLYMGLDIISNLREVYSQICFHASNIIVYPNPFRKILAMYIPPDNNSTHIYAITMYDITGRMIVEYTDIDPVNNKCILWDNSHLSAGTYFVKISTDNSYVIKQVVKMD